MEAPRPEVVETLNPPKREHIMICDTRQDLSQDGANSPRRKRGPNTDVDEHIRLAPPRCGYKDKKEGDGNDDAHPNEKPDGKGKLLKLINSSGACFRRTVECDDGRAHDAECTADFAKEGEIFL
jgi:hypothetical protein